MAMEGGQKSVLKDFADQHTVVPLAQSPALIGDCNGIRHMHKSNCEEVLPVE